MIIKLEQESHTFPSFCLVSGCQEKGGKKQKLTSRQARSMTVLDKPGHVVLLGQGETEDGEDGGGGGGGEAAPGEVVEPVGDQPHVPINIQGGGVRPGDRRG